MDQEKSKPVAFVKERVVYNYITTIMGILVAVLSAIGQEFQSIPGLEGIGQIAVGVAAFIGAISLLLAKDKNNKK